MPCFVTDFGILKYVLWQFGKRLLYFFANCIEMKFCLNKFINESLNKFYYEFLIINFLK